LDEKREFEQAKQRTETVKVSGTQTFIAGVRFGALALTTTQGQGTAGANEPAMSLGERQAYCWVSARYSH
jgi:hypothetical protein